MAEQMPKTEGKDPRPDPLPAAIAVDRLLCGRQEVRLVHRGVEYRLRVTRQGKLLLTK